MKSILIKNIHNFRVLFQVDWISSSQCKRNCYMGNKWINGTITSNCKTNLMNLVANMFQCSYVFTQKNHEVGPGTEQSSVHPCEYNIKKKMEPVGSFPILIVIDFSSFELRICHLDLKNKCLTRFPLRKSSKLLKITLPFVKFCPVESTNFTKHSNWKESGKTNKLMSCRKFNTEVNIRKL